MLRIFRDNQHRPLTPCWHITIDPLHLAETAYISHTYTILRDLKYIHLNKKGLLLSR